MEVHSTNSVKIFCFLEYKDDRPVKVLKASKCSSIAEQLVNSSTCANSSNLNRLKNIKTWFIVFNLIKLEASLYLLRKSGLCKQKYFG